MKDSHIQWTDNTFNPWEGCTKVSPGCANCYAEARNQRFAGGANWGKGAPRRRTVPSNWREPVKWNRQSQERFQAHNRETSGSFGHLDEMMGEPRRPRVFCASLADWLDDEVPIEWLIDLLELIRTCEFLDWQLLTKRPQNWRSRMELALSHCKPINGDLARWIFEWTNTVNGRGPANVWIGTTVEDQARADERIPVLVNIPSVVRFLSCEPLLERVDLGLFGNCAGHHKPAYSQIAWVIVGGESGKGCRNTNVDHIEHVINQCTDAGVACFVKQLGAKPSSSSVPPGVMATRVKDEKSPRGVTYHWALEHAKGGEPDEWPERFRVQQFPNEETP